MALGLPCRPRPAHGGCLLQRIRSASQHGHVTEARSSRRVFLGLAARRAAAGHLLEPVPPGAAARVLRVQEVVPPGVSASARPGARGEGRALPSLGLVTETREQQSSTKQSVWCFCECLVSIPREGGAPAVKTHPFLSPLALDPGTEGSARRVPGPEAGALALGRCEWPGPCGSG